MSYSDKPSFWSRLFGRANIEPDSTGPSNEAASTLSPGAKQRARGLKTRAGPDNAAGEDPLPNFSRAGRGGKGGAFDRAVTGHLRNAFTPSHPILSGKRFAGRRALLQRMIRLLEDQHLHLVLYGDRGIGKTSLLRVLKEQASGAGYFASYASCGTDTSFDSLIRSFARDIPLLFHADFQPTDIEVERGDSFNSLFDSSTITVADATSALEKVQGANFLLLIDEFDRLSDTIVREQMAELIKNLSDRSTPLQFVIAGVASNLTALFSHIPSIRRNLIGLPVGRLTEDETHQLLDLGSRTASLTFKAGAKELITKWSHGLPYLAQLLALHSGSSAVRSGRAEIDLDDVHKAGQEAEEEIGLRLTDEAQETITRECVGGNFTALRALAKAALDGGDALQSEAFERLAPQVRSTLLLERNGHVVFQEEASVSYILLLGRLLERGETHLVAAPVGR
jgi:Cdc6-like AAA superfamily ATPase